MVMAKYKHKIPINDRVIISQRHFFGINKKASLINDIFAVNDLVAKSSTIYCEISEVQKGKGWN